MKVKFLEYWGDEIIGMDIIAETTEEKKKINYLLVKGQELGWYEPHLKFNEVIRIRLK